MSEHHENCSEDTPRQLVDMRAAAFVERRDCDSWTDSNEAELETWLNQAPAHRVAFIRLNASWRRTERLAALRPGQQENNPSPDARNWRRYLKGAAIFGLAILSSGLVAAYLLMPHYDTYATTVGGRETLTLHDGSRIELNTNTVVRVSQNPDRRFVQLDKGEAFFEIRHDAKHPFVVVAAGRRLIDLGTKFSVRTDADGLRVALVEGRVRFEPQNGSDQDQLTLLPGDVLLASAGVVSVKKQTIPDLTNALAWRRGMLLFHETTLLDAAREFNRYNETKIIINDPRAAHETINGTLPANDLEEFSRMARNIFGLKTERRGNEILFTR